MEIALVDDLSEERERLRKKLTQQLESRGVRADFSEFESGEDFLEAAKQRPFPVVFLDIYMSGISGMEVAKALRREGSKCQIVFTTTSTDHALEGFKVPGTAVPDVDGKQPEPECQAPTGESAAAHAAAAL